MRSCFLCNGGLVERKQSSAVALSNVANRHYMRITEAMMSYILCGYRESQLYIKIKQHGEKIDIDRYIETEKNRRKEARKNKKTE